MSDRRATGDKSRLTKIRETSSAVNSAAVCEYATWLLSTPHHAKRDFPLGYFDQVVPKFSNSQLIRSIKMRFLCIKILLGCIESLHHKMCSVPAS